MWDELESRDYGWRGLPRYALGASSGGAMALVLAQVFPLQVGFNFRHSFIAHPQRLEVPWPGW